jgi:hypothetical protein
MSEPMFQAYVLLPSQVVCPYGGAEGHKKGCLSWLVH